jgi:hypothetical protein
MFLCCGWCEAEEVDEELPLLEDYAQADLKFVSVGIKGMLKPCFSFLQCTKGFY